MMLRTFAIASSFALAGLGCSAQTVVHQEDIAGTGTDLTMTTLDPDAWATEPTMPDEWRAAFGGGDAIDVARTRPEDDGARFVIQIR